MYGYFRTYRFNFAALAGLCFALFSVSSVAQQLPPGQGVSATWNPTTSHWQTNGSTFRTPPGTTSTSTGTSVGPVTRTPTGGAAQPMGSGITIQSIERSAPVSSVLRTGPAALRTAVVRCFGNPLCTLGVTGASLGLQELLDRMDWSIFGDELVTEQTSFPSPVDPPADGIVGPFTRTAEGNIPAGEQWSSMSCTETEIQYCAPTRSGRPFIGVNLSESGGQQWQCPIMPTRISTSRGCVYGPLDSDPYEPEVTRTPVSPSDISNGVDQNYDFHPSDWPVIGPHIPLNSSDVDIEITSAPSLTTPPVTTTEYDADGVPHTITETNIDYSFAPRPGTNPGPKPALDLEETTTTTSSTADGTVTGSKTTTTTRPAGDTTPGTGSGGGSTPDTPWPAFCAWASVVCGWLDWTQEGWDQEEPDLPQIIDFAPEGDFQVGGPGDCPAPYNINLGWMLNTTLEVSYQPFCDFAGLVKPLFLAFCYLFAGVITVRSL